MAQNHHRGGFSKLARIASIPLVVGISFLGSGCGAVFDLLSAKKDAEKLDEVVPIVQGIAKGEVPEVLSQENYKRALAAVQNPGAFARGELDYPGGDEIPEPEPQVRGGDPEKEIESYLLQGDELMGLRRAHKNRTSLGAEQNPWTYIPEKGAASPNPHLIPIGLTKMCICTYEAPGREEAGFILTILRFETEKQLADYARYHRRMAENLEPAFTAPDNTFISITPNTGLHTTSAHQALAILNSYRRYCNRHKDLEYTFGEKDGEYQLIQEAGGFENFVRDRAEQINALRKKAEESEDIETNIKLLDLISNTLS